MGGMMMAQNADTNTEPPAPTPWTTSPPIVQGGDVFVLPDDGKYILIYDAGNGRLVKEMRKDDCCQTLQDDDPNAVIDERRPDTLLGVIPDAQVFERGHTVPVDLLVVATPCRVCAIQWRKYDANHPMAALAWVSYPTGASAPPAGTPPAQAVRTIRGRCFVTDNCVLVPTDAALLRVSIRTGRLIDSFPPSESWAEDQEPGNVVASGGYIVIAGEDHVDAYTDLKLAEARLDKAIADAPNDPDPRLRCAEVMFVADQIPLALKNLDEAMDLLRQEGADGTMPIGATRDRIFADALSFAARLSRRPHPSIDLIDELFSRAGAAATSDTQQVTWRMEQARFARQTADDLPTAVRLYQHILADPHLRTVPVPSDSAGGQNDDAGATQAGIAAQDIIQQILSQSGGKAAYAPFEAQAVAQFDAARASQDAQKLLQISTEFPNSSVELPALRAAADTFETQGQPRQATQTLRQIYLQTASNDPIGRARVLEAMARNYLHLPDRLDAAVSRMNQAAQLAASLPLVKPLALPDGSTLTRMTLADAAAAMQKVASAVSSAHLPIFGFPSHAVQRQYERRYDKAPVLLREDPSLSIGGIDELVRPLPEFSRFDRLVTWTQGSGLAIYPTYASTPSGSCPDCDVAPTGCAWVAPPTTRPGGDDLLAWTPSSLLLMDGNTAATQWKLNVATLPSLDVMAEVQPDQPMPVGPIINPGGGIIRGRIIIGPNARVIVRGGLVINGPINLPMQLAPMPLKAAPAAAESISGVTPVGDLAIVRTSNGRVACVSLEKGDILWQMRLADHQVDRILADDDFTVVKVTDNNDVELVVLDTGSGRLLARRGFSIDSGTYPVNFALGDDGTLAYTTPDQLFIYDLYELKTDQSFGDPKGVTPQTQDTQNLFNAMVGDHQLLIHDGLVLAVCQNGGFVRGYSEQNGQLRQYYDGSQQQTPMVLTTGTANQPDTALALAGQYFYAWSAANIVGYNIEHPYINWSPAVDPDPPVTDRYHELFIGKDALVLLDDPGSVTAQPNDDAGSSASCRVRAYSRMQLPGRKFATESGVCFVNTD
ncbi:MAG TPA: hypothetical protein VMD30_05335, partial [Tepidisphaeraceae bacterium]|nr:hypothetical protein [Tepidisphaeraceae bacterium]